MKHHNKDPSTESKDPITYTKEELLQQNTKLMNQVHTMRIKKDKLDSLILEEHDNLKECLMELDLLKQRLITKKS